MLLLLHTLLSLAAAALVVGLIQLPLRLEERVLATVVVAVVLGAMASYLAAAWFGFGTLAVLLGPPLLGGAALLVTMLGGGLPWQTWLQAWSEAVQRWRQRPRWWVVAFAVAITVFWSLIFAHALFLNSDGLQAGYQTVWADWSQHLTTQASFAVGGNVPPVNPLFSGTPLYYPFMPDFHSAELMQLGLSPGAALALPGAVLGVVISLLLVCLAERIGAHPAVGGIAAVISVLGGGLGFVRLASDACLASYGATKPEDFTSVAAQQNGCDLHQLVGNLGQIPRVVGNLGTVIHNQPRAYDGLLTAYDQLAVHNLQWPTPLMGWWLPQRSFIYGLAAVLVIMLVVTTAVHANVVDRFAWGVIGVLAGVLPLYHVHSLIALGVFCVVAVVVWRRREWLVFAVCAAVVAGPRMVQLARGPHGDVADANLYPSFPPGWRFHFDPLLPNSGLDLPGPGPQSLVSTVATGVLHTLALPFQADWWLFWIANMGIAIPLLVIVLVAAGLRLLPWPRIKSRANWLVAPFPNALLVWAGGALLLFLIANVVVFQTWDWDNTKLFAYAYLGAAMVIGCLAVHLWRGWWRRVVAVLMVASVIGSGLLVVVRLTPWEASASRSVVAGPYTVESTADIDFAKQLAAATPRNAVFLTSQRPQDPVLTLAGRTTIMGYWGWLWSYGTVIGSRQNDAKAMYKGCQQLPISDAGCPVRGLLDRYGIGYVEVDTRGDTNGIVDIDATWWSQQGFAVVAQSRDVVVYDVGRP